MFNEFCKKLILEKKKKELKEKVIERFFKNPRRL